jgi:hypothetical protein
MELPDWVREEQREAQRNNVAAAKAFVRACKKGDVAALYKAVNFINDHTERGWTTTMRKFAWEVRHVSPDIQSAFLRVWIGSPKLPRLIDPIPLLRHILAQARD